VLEIESVRLILYSTLPTIIKTLAALLKRCWIVARSLPQIATMHGLHTILRVLATLLKRFWIITRESLP
jgi:hypothetical protein